MEVKVFARNLELKQCWMSYKSIFLLHYHRTVPQSVHVLLIVRLDTQL